MSIYHVSALLVINIRNVKEYLKLELRLSDEESEAFLFIINNGRTNLEKVAKSSKFSINMAYKALQSLVEKGMIIKISTSEYESLHPKFAVTNRYRKICQDESLPFKKNILIDNIGTVLERPFDDARTK